MVTEFIFVRHGETDANRAGILQGGSINLPLNETGKMQAEAVAEYLKEIDFDVAFSSDLLRAAETARIIIDKNQNGIPLFMTPQLQEWKCGEMDGMSFTEIYERFPQEGKSFAFEQIDTVMPGGECGRDFQERVESFLKNLCQDYAGKKILLVAHGGVLQRIFRLVAGVVADGNLIPLAGNASVSSFVFNHKFNAWQLTSWNNREHLKGIPQHILRVL